MYEFFSILCSLSNIFFYNTNVITLREFTRTLYTFPDPNSIRCAPGTACGSLVNWIIRAPMRSDCRSQRPMSVQMSLFMLLFVLVLKKLQNLLKVPTFVRVRIMFCYSIIPIGLVLNESRNFLKWKLNFYCIQFNFRLKSFRSYLFLQLTSCVAIVFYVFNNLWNNFLEENYLNFQKKNIEYTDAKLFYYLKTSNLTGF